MKYFIGALLILLQMNVLAQIVTLEDANTKTPLELVTITNMGLSKFTTTNAKGQADLSEFLDEELLEIRLMGYEPINSTKKQLASLNYVVAMNPSDIYLDQVVISATKWRTEKKDVPAKISVLTAKDIALQNPQTAADLMGASGEVFIQKSQLGGGSPMIRGFSTNRLLISVDGVRMNTAIFRSGNLQNIISIDPFAVENAEVLFGPGSVIYGSDAIGGVMSFRTLTPQFSLNDELLVSGKAVTRYASANNEKTVHFDVQIAGKKVASATSFSSTDFGDLTMGSVGPEEYLRTSYVARINDTDVVVANPNPLVQTPMGYTQHNLMQKFRYKPNANWDISYGFHYSTTSNYARYDRLLRTRNGKPRSAVWEYGPQTWIMNNLSINHKKANALYNEMVLRVAYQYFEESRIDRNFNSTDLTTNSEYVNALSANLDFTKTIGARGTFNYGAEAVTNLVESTGEIKNISTGEVVLGPSRYPQATWSSIAAYASFKQKISKKLLVEAGARYNQFIVDATFDTTFYPFPFTTAALNKGALSGSLGLIYNPNKKLTMSLVASTGFRAPNVDDLGKVFDSEPGSVVIPNPNLNAEYAYNIEFDIAKEFGDFLKVDVTGYYTLLNNALVRRDFTLNGLDSIVYNGELSQVQAIQNAAQATVYGVQAGVELKLPKGFSLTSKYSFQHGVEELDNGETSPSRHAAPAFGVTRLNYSQSKVNLQFYALYSAGKSFDELPAEEQSKDFIYAIDANGNPYSPSWYTLNFKALYQLTPNIALTAGLENITDVRYRPYSSGIVAPGRNYIFALRANF